MTERSAHIPLPNSVGKILRLVRRMLTLERTLRIIIDENSIVLVRDVEEGDEVLPREVTPADFDVDVLLKRLQLWQLELDPVRSLVSSVILGSHMLQKRDIVPTSLVVGNLEQFIASITSSSDAISLDIRAGDHFMGMKVIEAEQDKLPEKILVLGSAVGSVLPEEATHGVVLDIL